MLPSDNKDAPKRGDGLGLTIRLWPAVLLVIYWLTSSVVVATLIPSVITALPALRTGWWIRGYELRLGCRTRANTLWCFYLADALWLSAASAFTTVLILIIINAKIGIQPNMTKFATAMLIIAGGVVLTTLIGLYASYDSLLAIQSRKLVGYREFQRHQVDFSGVIARVNCRNLG